MSVRYWPFSDVGEDLFPTGEQAALSSSEKKQAKAGTRRLLNSLPWVYAHSTWAHGGLVRMFVAYRLLETQ